MHDFLLGIFTDGYHAVGTLAGMAELEVVYLPVYPMIVLGSMDKDEVVNGDDVFAFLAASLHLSLLGSSDVERKLVAQAMEDLDAVLCISFVIPQTLQSERILLHIPWGGNGETGA